MEYFPLYRADDLLNGDYYLDIPLETLDLMVSMLNRAQQDLGSIDARVYRDAKLWIERKDDQDYFLSFESICRNIGLDPVKARERIYHGTDEMRQRKKHEYELRKEKKNKKST
ncbi:MAG: hypothetical protein Q8R37_02280, partial [Nanoarchaeota archaeon]|nr:hypothetical protein [Nanoarchaeota archaeon]